MPRQPTISAGIALVRPGDSGHPEVLLVHPGGPFWARKDEHAWSIPKGEVDQGSEVRETAVRELAEETGHHLGPDDVSRLVALPELRIGSGKVLRAFAVAGDLDPATITSNTFEMEWPPRSGRVQSFPEVDRGAWYSLDDARHKLHKGQAGLVDHLEEAIEQAGLVVQGRKPS